MDYYSEYAALLDIPSNIAHFLSVFNTATDDSYTTMLTPEFNEDLESYYSVRGMTDDFTDVVGYTSTNGANPKVFSYGGLVGVAALLLL